VEDRSCKRPRRRKETENKNQPKTVIGHNETKKKKKSQYRKALSSKSICEWVEKGRVESPSHAVKESGSESLFGGEMWVQTDIIGGVAYEKKSETI